MLPVDWNELIRRIDRFLPGRGLWMQCAPVFDEASPTEEGVGLAIQKEHGPVTNRYTVVFFTVTPDPDFLGGDGGFLHGHGDEAPDWNIEVGYQGDFDTLEEAVAEAKNLAIHLPISPIFANRDTLLATLDKVSDPDDLGQSA